MNIKTCSVKDCRNIYSGKGLCKPHYDSLRRHGNLTTPIKVKHGKCKTKEFISWQGMRARCRDTHRKNYKNYGGRGIKVCEQWDTSFLNFYKDMGDKPFSNAQIDRIDNDGNYSPENCRWVTPIENIRSKKYLKLNIESAIEIRDIYKKCNITYKDLAKKFGVTQSTIGDIIHNRIWKEVLN